MHALITAAFVSISAAAARVAEEQQHKQDNEPQNCVSTAE